MDCNRNLEVLFAPGVAWAQAEIPSRRLEFAIGRELARHLLAGFGMPGVDLPVGANGAPRWPQGMVGSIAHSDTWCVVAVAPMAVAAALGIDVVPLDQPLDPGLLELIAQPRERAWVLGAGPSRCDLRTRLLFCAKESSFKCLDPATQDRIDFRALGIEFAPDESSFRADLGATRPASGRAAVIHAHAVTVLEKYR